MTGPLSPRWAAVVAAASMGVLALGCGNDLVTPNGTPSPATSEISVSASLAEAGEVVELFLTLRDENGGLVASGDESVAFRLTDGQSGGILGPTIYSGVGVYRTTLSATQAGTPSKVGATLNGAPVTTPEPAVTVVPGPASPAASLILASATMMDVGGESVFRLEARDAFDNPVGTGGADVVFSLAGGTSRGTIGPVADNDDGSYEAVFTAEATGTPATVGATLDGVAVTSRPPSVEVAAGQASPSTSELFVSTDTIVVGTAATVGLRTYDAQGRPSNQGGRTVVFSIVPGSGTSQGAFESDTVDLGDGSYTSRFRGTDAGTAVQIQATIDGAPITTPLPTITVVDRVPSPQHSVVTVSDSLVQAGDSATLTLVVKDVDGDDLGVGGNVVRFTFDSTGGGSGGTIDSTMVIDRGDGTYTGTFVAVRARGPAIIGATIDGIPVEMPDTTGASQLPTIRVTPGPASVDSSTAGIDDALLDLGQTTTVRLTTRDDWGNPLTAGGATVAFALTGLPGPFDHGTVGATVDNGDGTYAAPFTATIDGAAPNWIRPTIDMVPVNDSVSVAVVCATGPISLSQSTTTVSGLLPGGVIPSGVPITITFTARDDAGNCLLASGRTVAFSTSGGTSTGVIGPTIDQQDGTYSAIFTGVLAGSPTAILTTVDGAPVTSPPPSIEVDPGDVSAMQSVVSTGDSLVDPGTVVVLGLQARDAAGNDITQDTLGLAVVFNASGGTSVGTIGATTSLGDGTFTAPFTALAMGTPVSIGATIEGTAVATPMPTVEVDTVAPGASTVTIAAQPAVTITAGDTVPIRLRAKDDQGRDIRGAGKVVVFAVVGGAGVSDGLISATVDVGDGSYLAGLMGTTAGSAASVATTLDGAAVTTPTPSFTVVPGPASGATSTVAVSDTLVSVGGTLTVLLTARDAFGNQQTGGGLQVVFGLAGGTSAGTFGPVSDNGDGTYDATFQATVAGTPVSVTATIDGQAVANPPTIRVQ